MDDQSSDGEKRVRCGMCGGSGKDPVCPVCDPAGDPADEPESHGARRGITMPKTGRITEISVGGVRQPIDPPIEVQEGDEIFIGPAPESHGQRRIS